MIYFKNDDIKLACMTNDAMAPHRPNQGFEIHKSAGYSRIVLNMEDYISGYEIQMLGKTVISTNVQKHEKVSDKPELLWTYGMLEVEEAKRKGMTIPMIVAPYRLRTTRREDLNDFLALMAAETMQLCKDAECKYALIYPPSYKSSDKDMITEWYEKLIPTAIECGVRILIANQSKDVNGHLVRGIFAESQDAAEWIESMNKKASAELFGFCADIGTYNVCGQNIQQELRILGSRVKAVIVRENDGKNDSSLLPYTCTTNGICQMDYMGMIRGLREIDFDGYFILNMRDTCASVPTKLREELVHTSKRFMDFFAWQIGMEKSLKKYKNRVLFGAGNMTRNYMKCYGEEFPPLFICDNNEKRWGTEFEGVLIKKPEELLNLPDDCAIYICNLYYNEVSQQLEQMGISNPVEYFNDEYMPNYHFTRI